MKSAICLSGLPRGLLECSKSIIKNLIEPNKADVFIHAWDNPEKSGELYRTSHPVFQSKHLESTASKIIDIYKPKYFLLEPQIQFTTDGFHSIYQPNDKYFIFAIQSMFYSIKHSNECKRKYEFDINFKYDAVCRCRFDMIINKPIVFDELDLTKINIKNDCKHEQGCTNDHIAVSSSRNMDIYSSTYNVMYGMYHDGCPWCGEIFLGRWLKKNNLEIVDGGFDYRLLEAT
jgi:hypothetical protein